MRDVRDPYRVRNHDGTCAVNGCPNFGMARRTKDTGITIEYCAAHALMAVHYFGPKRKKAAA